MVNAEKNWVTPVKRRAAGWRGRHRDSLPACGGGAFLGGEVEHGSCRVDSQQRRPRVGRRERLDLEPATVHGVDVVVPGKVLGACSVYVATSEAF
jgi:hypothetical protein